MRNFIHYSLAGIMAVGFAGVATAQKSEFSNWPAGTSPQEVGKKIAENMIPRWIPSRPGVHYAEDSTWYAALEFAKVTNDQALTDLMAAHPELDAQHLRTLIRNARKEQAENKPPKAYREIFQLLKHLDKIDTQGQGNAGDGDAEDEDDEPAD